ncbi:MAG: GNAT family N-acetyltransferase [Lachnospiraceae bacterium]|nr:GNAT family N-acetyltransferase [Lachnospiraceae bacterium]
MQIEIIKRDDIESKLKTRKLYEACFDEGKDDFINYYYDTIIKRNEMVVAREGDEVLSMIHLNPYVYNICGDIKNVHYLVAIATKKEHRGKGLMASCMNKAVEYLKSLSEPFCYLVPENDGVKKAYTRIGFEIVSKFSIDKFSDDKFDIYPQNNDEYIELMKNEENFLKFESDEYVESLKNKIVMFNVLDNKNYNIDYFKSKKIYVCQEV